MKIQEQYDWKNPEGLWLSNVEAKEREGQGRLGCLFTD